jgi:hypothetical protein
MGSGRDMGILNFLLANIVSFDAGIDPSENVELC